jgi:hypothetical protein
MLKTLTAIGIGAAIAFAPLAALAQTDTTTAPAAAPAASDKMAPAKDSMKAKPHHKGKKKSAKKMKKEESAPAAPAEAPKS